MECVPEAVSLLERNREKFRLHNMTIHSGRALALAGSLPDPTHVFVGGSGGELRGLLELLPGRAGAVRVVVAAVTLQTLSEAVTALSGPGYRDLEAVQISVSASRALGRSLLMAARNPVTLLCAWCRPRFAIDGLCP